MSLEICPDEETGKLKNVILFKDNWASTFPLGKQMTSFIGTLRTLVPQSSGTTTYGSLLKKGRPVAEQWHCELP